MHGTMKDTENLKGPGIKWGGNMGTCTCSSLLVLPVINFLLEVELIP